MKQGIREAFPVLGRAGFHYLDNAAMAQMPGLVAEAMAHLNRMGRGNVRRGLHQTAQLADEAYGAARASVGRFLAVPPEEVVFTSGCTAALNIAAHGLSASLGPGDEVVLSVLEHHSACLPWIARSRERGFALRWLPATAEGRLDLSRLGEIVTERCRVVAATHASNVTGAVTDLPAVAAAAKAVGAVLLVDGAQAAPHGMVHPAELGADLYAFSGHKTYGPTGIGVLWGRADILNRMEPLLLGGGMVGLVEEDELTWADPPDRFEAGTPPVAQAVGLGAALDWLMGLDWPNLRRHDEALLRRLLDGLIGLDGVTIVGPKNLEARLPVVSFTVAGCHPHDVAHVLADRGVAVRAGAHCAKPLMRALGLEEGTLRASLAPYNDEADVEALLQGIDAAMARLR